MSQVLGRYCRLTHTAQAMARAKGEVLPVWPAHARLVHANAEKADAVAMAKVLRTGAGGAQIGTTAADFGDREDAGNTEGWDQIARALIGIGAAGCLDRALVGFRQRLSADAWPSLRISLAQLPFLDRGTVTR